MLNSFPVNQSETDILTKNPLLITELSTELFGIKGKPIESETRVIIITLPKGFMKTFK